MTALQTLYDFETPVEQAFALLLAQNNLTVFTPSNQTLLTDAFKAAHPELLTLLPVRDLEQIRPRIELQVQMGSSEQVHYPIVNIPPLGGYCHDLAFTFTLSAHVITAPDIGLHRQYTVALRTLLATCLNSLNGFDPLTRHRIQELNFGGGSTSYLPQEDVFDETVTWAGRITIQNEALAAALADS